jgi:tetratricopeptide (TPR) repeat protein
VVALLDSAYQQQESGSLSEAAASLERALRIEPRNAMVWHQLAVVRFRQGQLDQAEQMALKSEALAGTDNPLRARNWRLIALVRQQRGDAAGARAAQSQADALGSR